MIHDEFQPKQHSRDSWPLGALGAVFLPYSEAIEVRNSLNPGTKKFVLSCRVIEEGYTKIENIFEIGAQLPSDGQVLRSSE